MREREERKGVLAAAEHEEVVGKGGGVERGGGLDEAERLSGKSAEGRGACLHRLRWYLGFL